MASKYRVYGYTALVYLVLMLSTAATASLMSVSVEAGGTDTLREGGGEVPFYVSWILHFHQPLYNENGSLTELLGSPDKPSWLDNVWLSRVNIYRGRAADAAMSCPGNCTLQVDVTGTLIQQLNELEESGWYDGAYAGWRSRWAEAACSRNPAGYPKLSFTISSYHHVIYPLVERLGTDFFIEEVMRHRAVLEENFGCGIDDGFFPIEESFSPEMIPVLERLGIRWTVVDSLHVLRATHGYYSVYTPPPNRYDVRNPDPGLWDWGLSPGLVFRPHIVEYNGSRITVFIRYREISQASMSGISADHLIQTIQHFQKYNTDPRRPFIMVIVHDGDNGFPGHNDGRDFYETFLSEFFAKISSEPELRFIRVIGLTEYLDKVYNPANDTGYAYSKIWVEPGSWETMDTWGDPFFAQWSAPDIESPDQERWGLATLAAAYYHHAVEIVDDNGLQDTYSDVLEDALDKILVGLSSDYYYWDGDQWWDSKAKHLFAEAIEELSEIINGYTDTYEPAAMYVWREPYNPEGYVTVYVHAGDPSGIANVSVHIIGRGYEFTASAERIGQLFFRAALYLPETATYHLFIDVADNYGNRGRAYATSFYGGRNRYIMDGELDGTAYLLYENTSNQHVRHLWVDLAGDILYVATDGEAGDVFIFLSTNLSGFAEAPWAKQGLVAGYDYYLGCEHDNGWSGWFRKGDEELLGYSTGSACGSVVEGYVNLTELYGGVPEQLNIAVAVYESQDAGRLIEVLVHGDGDWDVDADEYAVLNATGPPPAPITEPGLHIAIIIAVFTIIFAAWVLRRVHT